MSQDRVGSKARTLWPLTLRASPSSRSRWTSAAKLAKNTSPRPRQRISGTPSPVTAFLSIRPTPPEPWYSKSTWPWKATMLPWRASTSPSRATRSMRGFCRAKPSPEVASRLLPNSSLRT